MAKEIDTNIILIDISVVIERLNEKIKRYE